MRKHFFGALFCARYRTLHTSPDQCHRKVTRLKFCRLVTNPILLCSVRVCFSAISKTIVYLAHKLSTREDFVLLVGLLLPAGFKREKKEHSYQYIQWHWLCTPAVRNVLAFFCREKLKLIASRIVNFIGDLVAQAQEEEDGMSQHHTNTQDFHLKCTHYQVCAHSCRNNALSCARSLFSLAKLAAIVQ